MGGNSSGFVWALPEGVDMPDPNDPCLPWGSRMVVQPFCRQVLANPRPPGGEWDFRTIIEGDGSSFSYVCHSLLARVLVDFGARSHGEIWSAVDMLADDPEVRDSGDQLTVRLFCYTRLGCEQLTVRLFCYTRLGCEGTFTVVDTYHRGSFAFEWRHEDVVEVGPGFVH
jgi:hypothetical protein